MLGELVEQRGALAFALHPAPKRDRSQQLYLRNAAEVVEALVGALVALRTAGKIVEVVSLAEMVSGMQVRCASLYLRFDLVWFGLV